jgi:hypothetical protein
MEYQAQLVQLEQPAILDQLVLPDQQVEVLARLDRLDLQVVRVQPVPQETQGALEILERLETRVVSDHQAVLVQ